MIQGAKVNEIYTLGPSHRYQLPLEPLRSWLGGVYSSKQQSVRGFLLSGYSVLRPSGKHTISIMRRGSSVHSNRYTYLQSLVLYCDLRHEGGTCFI